MVAPVQAPVFPASSRFPGELFRTSSPPFRSRSGIAIPRVPRAAAPPVSPLSFPRPPAGRTNHLRHKLLKTLTPPPPPHLVLEAPQAPPGGRGEASHAWVEEDDPRELQPPLLSLSQEIPIDGIVEERESALLLRQQVGDQRPFFPNAAILGDFPRLLLELCVYLVWALAVQKVCVIWLRRGAKANVEEGKSAETATNATVGKVKGAGPEVGERGLEFERVVSAIQAMAREARAAEASEAAEKDGVSGLRGDILEEVNLRLGKLRKRMARDQLDAKALSNTLVKGGGSKASKTLKKGFNGSKDYDASTRDLGNGGSQKIVHDGRFKKPSQLRARRKSNAHGYNVPKKEATSSRDPVVSNFKNAHTVGDQNASNQGMFEKSRNGHMNGGTWNNPVSWEVVEDSSSFAEGVHHKQTDSSNKASGMASKTKKMGIPHSQSFLGKKHGSSSSYRNSYTNSEIVSDKKTEHKHLNEKTEDSQSDAVNKLWWLKLPYVLAIFLHRGSDGKEFKGLYSLKLDSSSEEGSHSYTIVFEDRVDATNFCYLLESFFESLDDFFADIVPLSIQEVHDAVKSRTLKVIVVRKGQLQLYAGQPLAEAEMQLRSMLD